MARGLTILQVENAKPAADRREIPDHGKPGLYLVVQPSGRKSWAVRYRRLSDRKPRKYTLAGFPSLAQARKLAQGVLDKVAEGADPAADKVVEKLRARTQDPSDIESLFIEFLRRHTRKRNGQPIRESTKIETARLLGLKPDPQKPGNWIRSGNGVLKSWRGRTAESITKGDVLSLLDDLAETAPVSANRTLAALKTFFTWCIKRDKLDRSPCTGVDDPSPESARERPLSDDEVAALWRAADADGWPFGRMVQLLILTGCRRDEVRDATWSEFNLAAKEWLIPGARTKNGHDHVVPLSDTAMAVLEGLPRVKGRAGLILTTTGETPISGLSKAKARLHTAMVSDLGRDIERWTLHDLRHTLKTWMQRTRVPKDVRNAVQNHFDGDMDEHYGHYSFADEKRAALQAWGRFVVSLVEERVGNVAPLREIAAG